MPLPRSGRRGREIQTGATASPGDAAFDRDVFCFEVGRPGFQIIGGDGEGEMQRAVAVMRRDRAVRHMARLRRAMATEQQQHASAGHAERAHAVVVHETREPHQILVEGAGLLKVGDVESGLENTAYLRHMSLDFPGRAGGAGMRRRIARRKTVLKRLVVFRFAFGKCGTGAVPELVRRSRRAPSLLPQFVGVLAYLVLRRFRCCHEILPSAAFQCGNTTLRPSEVSPQRDDAGSGGGGTPPPALTFFKVNPRSST